MCFEGEREKFIRELVVVVVLVVGEGNLGGVQETPALLAFEGKKGVRRKPADTYKQQQQHNQRQQRGADGCRLA